jgi:hypothetical protein
MEALLNPDSRIPKMATLDRDIIIDVASEIRIGDLDIGLALRVPQGYPAVALNSLRFKDMIQDMVLAARDPERFDEKYATLLTDAQRAELKQGLLDLRGTLISQPGPVVLDLVGDLGAFVQRYYSNLLGRIENTGHRFGEDLSEREKQALIAFVATL